MSEINVGIVVYCKNNEGTIVNAIESILNQTVLPKSIFIVDDASDDDSWKMICRRLDITIDQTEFKTIINNINVVARSNEFEDGPVLSFRDGASDMWTECEWFGFLSASGYFLAEKIERCLEYMKDDNFSYIYSDFWYNTGNGIPVRAYYTSHWINHPDIGLFRKIILEKINFDDIKTFDDLHKIIRQNFLVAHIPKALQYANQ